MIRVTYYKNGCEWGYRVRGVNVYGDKVYAGSWGYKTKRGAMRSYKSSRWQYGLKDK